MKLFEKPYIMNWLKFLKVNAIDTSGLVRDYDPKISDIDGKIASITSLATIATLFATLVI